MKNNIKQKAEYCLNCKNPQCRIGCPLGNNIPAFIQKVKEDNLEEAYKILCETTVMPAICGRICPHQKQCQGKCVRGIKSDPVSIGEIEAYVGDWALSNTNSLLNYSENTQEKNKKIAVIGGGPSGLTAAAFLRRKGYQVTIYEKQKNLGGILKRGIPEFRLPNEIVEKTIEQILALGINVQCEKELGKNLELADIEKEFKATLDEALNADLLLHVVDASNDNADMQMAVTTQVLTELKANEIPMIILYNKIDKGNQVINQMDESICISAKTGENIDVLLKNIKATLLYYI